MVESVAVAITGASSSTAKQTHPILSLVVAI
jgi:hypothetical protein